MKISEKLGVLITWVTWKGESEHTNPSGCIAVSTGREDSSQLHLDQILPAKIINGPNQTSTRNAWWWRLVLWSLRSRTAVASGPGWKGWHVMTLHHPALLLSLLVKGWVSHLVRMQLLVQTPQEPHFDNDSVSFCSSCAEIGGDTWTDLAFSNDFWDATGQGPSSSVSDTSLSQLLQRK